MYYHWFEFLLALISLLTLSSALPEAKDDTSDLTPDYLKPPDTVKLSKFSLTQKGYIQHEEERFIRAWVTPGGEEIRLNLKEIEIIKVPVNLKENQWYHICQSWSTKTGHWDLFLNGKLKSHGYNSKARGQILPKDGDIVVGQEYTDFDKGLDDGIEGDVFGFNLVLASTTAVPKSQRHQKEPTVYSTRRVSHTVPDKIKGHYIVASGPLYLRRVSKAIENEVVPNANNNTENSTESTLNRSKRQSYNVYPVPYVRVLPVIPREKLIIKHINPYYYPINSQYGQSYQYTHHSDHFRPPVVLRNKNSRISNDISQYSPKPLGLQLVELSFRCDLDKGAPLKGKDVLISWTKSPVRVFGGAILKKVEPFCY